MERCIRTDNPAAAPGDRPPGARATSGRPASLLALATSGAWTSVAVLRAGPRGLESQCVAEPAGADQSERLLAMIDELLGGGLQAIDAIAFDAGPGSFTGLRLGCSIAQGLGLARALPLVPVGSLEAAAWRSTRSAGAAQALVLVANDARMGELYAAVCAARAPASAAWGPTVDLLAGPQLARPGALPIELSPERIEQAHSALAGSRWLLGGDAWHGAGDAWRVAGDAWRVAGDASRGRGDARPGSGDPRPGSGDARPGSGDARREGGLDARWPALAGQDRLAFGDPRDAMAGDALAVAELGWTLWRSGFVVDPADAVPRYVRNKVALDIDEQQRLRERRLVPTAGEAR